MKRFITALMLLTSVAGFAQTQASPSKYGPFLTNKFFDNWFLSAGVGGQVYYGEYDSKASFSDRITPAFDISLGKWFTPAFGFRAQFAGFNGKGIVNGLKGSYVDGASSEYTGYYNEKFSFFNLHGDLLMNFSNLFAGYNENRFYSFIPYVGAGYARSWNSSLTDAYRRDIGFNAGLLNAFRVSPAVDLNLEVRMLMVRNTFDGYAIGSGPEEMVSATVGFTYKFAKRNFDRPAPPVVPDYTPYTNKINDLEAQLAEKDANAKKLAADLQAEKNKPAKEIVKTDLIVPATTVLFKIGKYNISEREMLNIQNFAEAVKKVSGKVFTIMGIADKQTGSAKKNQLLSEMRAKQVYDALVNKFGVDPSILKLDPRGDTYQPYGKAYLNRVAIIEN